MTEVIRYDAAPVKPIDDPIELRDAIASDYQRAAQRNGQEIPFSLAQQIATADLTLVDRASDDIPKHPASKLLAGQEGTSGEPEYRDEGVATRIEEDADQCGMKFQKRRIIEKLDKETLGGIDVVKRMKLVKRIREVTRAVCAYKLDDPFGHYRYPKYAKMVAYVHADWNLCKGIYHDCPDQQSRDNIFYRQLEDIADQSNADPGLPNWWIK